MGLGDFFGSVGDSLGSAASAVGGFFSGLPSGVLAAGITTVGSLAANLFALDAQDKAAADAAALAAQQREEDRQLALELQAARSADAAAARRVQTMLAAINARAQAAQVDPGAAGFSRAADRLVQGSQIEQGNIANLIGGVSRSLA